MANRWGNSRETVAGFIFWGSKITADGECSHEIKTVAPWKKSYEKPSMLKSRDISLLAKVHLVKAVVFLVVMDGCEKESENEVAQSCLTLCDPMDCSLRAWQFHCWARVQYLVGDPASHTVAKTRHIPHLPQKEKKNKKKPQTL